MGGGGLLVQLQKALGEVLRAADAQRGGDGLDGGFGLADDLALAHLGQLGDHHGRSRRRTQVPSWRL